MIIDRNFDSGNIKKIRIDEAININTVYLEILKEKYPKGTRNQYKYWFYFKITDLEKNKPHKIVIENIDIIDNAWKGFKVPFSYDNKKWTRNQSTTTDFKNRTITWDFIPKKNNIWFAYYPPYDFKRCVKIANKFDFDILGKTKNKLPIYYLKKGTGIKHIWLLARQHPGETIGSWMLEGFLNEIVKRKHANILQNLTFHIILNANPSGTINGNWYTTQDSINLNRDWVSKKSTNTQLISTEMSKYKNYLTIDLHGDEESFKHFVAFCYGKVSPLYNRINNALYKNIDDFRKTNFYKKDYSQKALYTTNDCVNKGLTLEGAMKHQGVRGKSLEYVPLKIGKALANTMIDLTNARPRKHKSRRRKTHKMIVSKKRNSLRGSRKTRKQHNN